MCETKIKQYNDSEQKFAQNVQQARKETLENTVHNGINAHSLI